MSQKPVKASVRARTKTASKRSATSRKVTASKTKAVKKAQPKGITHHAKRIYHLTPKFIHGMVAGAFVGIIVVTSLGAGSNAEALTISSVRDCDSYSIINCGVSSSADLAKKAKNSYVAAVYRNFTISSTEIANISKTAVAGRVYKDGSVKVNGKVVATDAITAARKFVKGSHKVRYGGATFYVRHLKVSWSHTSVPAYVVLKNGKFNFAVLASCGNPIVATPKTPPTTPPPTTPPPTTPPPTTPPPTTPPPTTPPPTTPPPTTPPTTSKPITPVAKVKTLPNTGPGAILTILLLSILGGTIFHRTHHHIRHKRRAHRA